jgi:hypothetical protein
MREMRMGWVRARLEQIFEAADLMSAPSCRPTTHEVSEVFGEAHELQGCCCHGVPGVRSSHSEFMEAGPFV